MKNFATLFEQLDQTTKINQKVDALVQFFEQSSNEDKVWAVALLSGRRPKRGISSTRLREWAAISANIPLWLFEETYHVVGDLAETIALLVSHRDESLSNSSLADWMILMLELANKSDLEKQKFVFSAWEVLNQREVFLFNKLITGGFRIGVSQKLMTKALAKHTGIAEAQLAHSLMGDWQPQHMQFHHLISAHQESQLSKPYPFYLAYPLEEVPESLGEVQDWQIEYKWDGIRGQLIKRQDQIHIWSRGEELVTDRFPELVEGLSHLPNGTVLDGEIMAYKEGMPMDFQVLQTRIGRKSVSAKVLKEAPVIFQVYDLLEWNAKDCRHLPLAERRAILEQIFENQELNHSVISPEVKAKTWDEVAQIRLNSRSQGSEGLMLKRKSSVYEVGRKRGNWYKWKVDAMTIDAVLIYAMRGHGRRANLYTDYTFAVWHGQELVPFTKAYSGLTDEEFRQVDAFIRKHTLERFGPVRSVKPELVFEIAFEGIAKSNRHKSGIALRFPRMHRWRKDKPVQEANTLDDLNAILNKYAS